MSKATEALLTDKNQLKDIYMKAGIVDQFNTNQQSNMTLSAHSVITQSGSTVKINNSKNNGGELDA